MTFLQYCKDQQANRGGFLADFARDWVMDRERPRAPTFERLMDYLRDNGAIEAAQVAAAKLYGEWYMWARE